MNFEEQCVDCIVQGCQFSNFLKGEKYYAKDEKGDCYCLFHAAKELKEKFTYAQNELFVKTINEYIDTMIKSGRKIDFSNTIFHVTIKIFDKNTETLDIDFTNALFYEYVDIRNIKCKELVFEDTKFLKGGALKNREGTNNLHIEHLVFRPFVVESDFVIDIGRYANKDGKIEVDVFGTIKNIEFENHKEGKGIVYFVGLNQYVEKADFRNRNLDLVSFQNCNLSKCYFLNAKVDKTEFRNCIFPKNKDNASFGIFLIFSLNFILGAVAYYSEMKLVLLLHVVFFVMFYMALGESVSRTHFSIADELKTRQEKHSLLSLIEIYKALQKNISFSFQEKGDFFYAQRIAQLKLAGDYGSKNRDKLIYTIHYLVNGFGERYIFSFVMLLFIIIYFSFLYYPDKDFQATPQTPRIFFCGSKKDSNQIVIANNVIHYRVYWTKEENGEYRKHTISVGKILNFDNNSTTISGEHEGCQLQASLAYSISRFISPFTKDSQVWFKTISSKAIILSTIETILLYLFFGAFLLALKNRIKR